MGLMLCRGCKKMLYRQDACRGTSGKCKREDGGSTEMIGATSAVTSGKIRPAAKPRGPEKSTAARKDVPRTIIAEKPVEKRMLAESGETPTGDGAKAKALEAGTQAPPVDSEPEPLGLTATTPPRVGSATRKDAGQAAQALKRGRPKIHEDRKAYRAVKAKEYRERDKLKAEREGKTE